MKKIVNTAFVSLGVGLFIILVMSVTYAYLLSSASSEDLDKTGSGKLDIQYVNNGNLTGNLQPSTDKNGGINTSVQISKKEGSLDASIDIYLNPTTLPEKLKISGFKWEVIGTQGGKQVCNQNGDFSNATQDTPIKIESDYKLSTTPTTFTVYIWLDGATTNNDVMSQEFKGKIYVESNQIMGTLD